MVPLDCEAWEEVMVDCEGPSNPPDKRGNKYTLTYVCCLCHAALFEPLEALGHPQVRRAFARCIFRSGTLPQMIRSDRGPEFKNCLLAEYTALVGSRHRFGHAWRPMEQGMVERIHQEYQKILGMMLFDVFKCHMTEWSELLPVVELTIYNTPLRHMGLHRGIWIGGGAWRYR